MDAVTLIGILASTFSASSLLPQLLKIIKEKKADGVSLIMLLVLFTGLALWVYYGILKADIIIIISNSISISINLAIMAFMFKYKSKTNK